MVCGRKSRDRIQRRQFSIGAYMKRSMLLICVLALSLQGTQRPASQAAEPEKPGASINGFRFEFPCKDPLPENPKEGADGPSGLVTGDPLTTDNFTVQKQFGG